jgi:hypothetical protein
MEVPRSLRSWFVGHAVISVAAALPLLAAPGLVLRRLGWTAVDPVTAGLAGAALLAIGAASFVARDAGIEVYRALLRLNLIWSFAAACALFTSIGGGAPPAAWALLSVFICFAGVWLHHAIRFRQLDRASALDDTPEEEDAPPDSPRD